MNSNETDQAVLTVLERQAEAVRQDLKRWPDDVKAPLEERLRELTQLIEDIRAGGTQAPNPTVTPDRKRRAEQKLALRRRAVRREMRRHVASVKRLAHRLRRIDELSNRPNPANTEVLLDLLQQVARAVDGL